MAYSAADLTNVQAAIIALARGQRKVRLTMGDKSIEYATADISKLEKLRSQISAELSSTSRFFLTKTSKGL